MRQEGGEGRTVNRASLSETMTSHRWQTIGQPVTFQQAAKSREKEREATCHERGEDGHACLARLGNRRLRKGERKKGCPADRQSLSLHPKLNSLHFKVKVHLVVKYAHLLSGATICIVTLETSRSETVFSFPFRNVFGTECYRPQQLSLAFRLKTRKHLAWPCTTVTKS